MIIFTLTGTHCMGGVSETFMKLIINITYEQYNVTLENSIRCICDVSRSVVFWC